MSNRPQRYCAVLSVLLIGCITTVSRASTPRALWEDRVVSAPAIAPTISGDTLWVTGTDRKIRSHDARTGKRHWKRTLPSYAAIPVLVTDDYVLAALGAPRPSIAVLKRSDGREKWTARTRHQPVGIERVDNLFLFATLGGEIGARSLDDGTVIWSRQLERSVAGIETVGQRLYVLARRDSLWCIDSEDGRRNWAVAIDGTHAVPPLALENTIARLSYAGDLVLHDLATGQIRARTKLTAPQVSGPQPADGMIATVAAGGEIEVVNADSLNSIMTDYRVETVSAGVRVWGDWWVVSTLKGRVYALTRSRGVNAWSLTFDDPISLAPAGNGKLLAVIDDRGVMVVYQLDGAQ